MFSDIFTSSYFLFPFSRIYQKFSNFMALKFFIVNISTLFFTYFIILHRKVRSRFIQQ